MTAPMKIPTGTRYGRLSVICEIEGTIDNRGKTIRHFNLRCDLTISGVVTLLHAVV